MTREEHIDIREFIERVVNGAQTPMDVEADAIIRALFVRNPDAAYRMTMLALAMAKAQLAAAPALRAEPPRMRPSRGQGNAWITSLFTRRPRRRVTQAAIRS